MKKPASRPARWNAAVADAMEIASSIEDLKNELETALEAVKDVQSEYEEWKDGLPENLEQSALGEKLAAVCDLDFDVLDSVDVSAVLDVLSEAEGADLPLGFGRD
jgi:Tfp pilus assembly protein FimV